ncbi:MAG: sulfatase-like hydrolase/transferase [Candidatus Solibacter sp.]
MRRTFLAALSFANICYLRVWSELLTYRRWDTYLMTTPPKPVEYYALIANVLLGALILTGLAALARRLLPGSSYRIAEMLLVAAICIPLNAIRAVLSVQFPLLKSPLIELLGMRGTLVLGAILGLTGLIVVVFYHRRAAGIMVAVLTALSPFCVVTFGQALFKAANYDDTAYRNKPAAARLPVMPKLQRVVWVIADEWDYRLTFLDRDPTLPLPEIDRLRGISVSGSAVAPPGQETPVSMPGFYSGKLVNYVDHDGARELNVRFHGENEDVRWSAERSIFDQARALGANTALLDWYHPTCRMLNSLTYCKWWPLAMQHNSMGEGFWQILPNQTRSLAETNILSLFGRTLTGEQQAGVYHSMMEEAQKLLTSPDYGLIVIHLPVPHAPHTYDRRTRTFTLGNKPYKGYIDSLALLDVTIGELRHIMQSAGSWDSSTVLFTSDHMYRDAEQLDGKSDGRIPYLLKLAGQKEGVTYAKGFNAVLSADLLMDAMRGQVPDAASAVQWLERNRQRTTGGETPAAQAGSGTGESGR